jgi:hypothetical protein
MKNKVARVFWFIANMLDILSVRTLLLSEAVERLGDRINRWGKPPEPSNDIEFDIIMRTIMKNRETLVREILKSNPLVDKENRK